MFKNGVEILNSRVAGSPSASTTDCMYIQYDFVGTGEDNVVCNVTWRMYNGSYTVDFLQQFISFILGITTYPMWYGTGVQDSFMLHLASIPYDSDSTGGFALIVEILAGMIMSNGLVQGVVWNRIKGFFKKASSFIANKPWPVVRPLANAAASVLPGPANLVLTRVVSGVDTVVTNVNSIAVSNGAKALITEDGQELGDKFEVTMQTHICELDENDEPIVLDTVTSDDYLW